MRTPLAPFALLTAALACAACGGETPKKSGSASRAPTPQAETQAATAADAAADSAAGATGGASGGSGATAPSAKPAGTTSDADEAGPHVSFSGAGGRAHWVGEAPPIQMLAVDPAKSEGCHEHAEMDLVDRSVLVDPKGGLANVVIEIDVAGAAPAPSQGSYEMDQEGCRYEPHVLVVPAGATIDFRNSDDVGHNVHTYAKRNESMNKTVAAGGVESQVYAKRDQVKVTCDLHPWMTAWVVVSEASVHAVSAADGSITLPPLPPGKHKVSCWHESLGSAAGTLVVGADGAIEALDLALTTRSGRGPR